MTLRAEGLTALGPAPFHANTLRRALLNLVQNALEAMAPGDTVTLRGRATPTHVETQVPRRFWRRRTQIFWLGTRSGLEPAGERGRGRGGGQEQTLSPSAPRGAPYFSPFW